RRRRTDPDARRNAAKFFRKQDRSARRDQWSAWSARDALRNRAHRALCLCLRHFWRPLMCASRTLGQFPVVAEEVGEEVIAPLGGRLGPSDFEAAADGVSTTTFAKFILPSQALVVDVGAFWFGADVVSGNRSAVGLAEGVTASN